MKNSVGLYKNCSTTDDFTGNIVVFDLTLMCVSGMLEWFFHYCMTIFVQNKVRMEKKNI